MTGGRIGIAPDDEKPRSGVGLVVTFAGEKDLGANGQVLGFGQLIEGLVGQPMLRIIDGNDAAIRLVALHFGQNLRDIREEMIPHAGSEFAFGRLVRRRAGRPETGNGDVLLQRQRSRHNLAINRADGFGSKRPVAALDQAAQDTVFAFGRINRQAVAILDRADFLRHRGPFVEQAEEFGINRVNFGAQGIEITHGIWSVVTGPSSMAHRRRRFPRTPALRQRESPVRRALPRRPRRESRAGPAFPRPALPPWAG